MQIATKALAAALETADQVVKHNTTLPILVYGLVEPIDFNSVLLTVTDQERTLRQRLEVQERARWTFLLPIPHARRFVAAIDADTCRIDAKRHLEISAGNATVTYSRAINAGDFPPQRDPGALEWNTLDRAALLALIDRVFFAAAHDETRWNLTGVYLEQQENLIRVSCTDGHRLATGTIAGKIGAPMLIPRTAVELLRDLLEGNAPAETVSVARSGKADLHSTPVGHFRVGRSDLDVKLIDGTFPDFQQVIPKKISRSAVVEVKPLLSAIARLETLVERGRPGLLLVFHSNLLALSVAGDESTGKDEIPVNYASDDSFQVHLNVRYLRQALATIPTERLVLEVDDPQVSPIMIRAEGDDSWQYVCMPMRL